MRRSTTPNTLPNPGDSDLTRLQKLSAESLAFLKENASEANAALKSELVKPESPTVPQAEVAEQSETLLRTPSFLNMVIENIPAMDLMGS